MASLDTTITYYVGRLLYQYQRPKAQQAIAILVKQIFADGLPWVLQDAFNLNTAIGAQLDTLGKYIGLPRDIGDPTPLPFFGFVDYVNTNPQNQNGLTDYNSSINSGVVFFEYGYSQQAATALSDTSYAFMLFLKIALNTSDNTLYSIQEILLTTLNGNVRVVDNRDMSLTYYVGTNIPVSPTVLAPYLPRPMGVRVANIIVQNLIITGSGDNIVTGSGDNIVAGNL